MNLSAWGKWKRCFTGSAKPGHKKLVNKYFCFLGSEWGEGVSFRLEDIKSNAIWKNKGIFKNLFPLELLGYCFFFSSIYHLSLFSSKWFGSQSCPLFICHFSSLGASAESMRNILQCYTLLSRIHSGAAAMASWQWGKSLTWTPGACIAEPLSLFDLDINCPVSVIQGFHIQERILRCFAHWN